jgi:hypothetical protein
MAARTFMLSLVLLFPCFGYAQNLKPLQTYIIESSPDAGRLSYVMARCAGLYMNMAIISEDSRPDLGKKYNEASLAASYKFIEMSELANKEKNPNYVTPKNITEKAIGRIQAISKNYMKIIEESYTTSGSYLANPVIRSDLEVCQNLVR